MFQRTLKTDRNLISFPTTAIIIERGATPSLVVVENSVFISNPQTNNANTIFSCTVMSHDKCRLWNVGTKYIVPLEWWEALIPNHVLHFHLRKKLTYLAVMYKVPIVAPIEWSRKMECRCGVMKVVSFVPSRSVLSPGITTQWSTPFQMRRWQSSPGRTEHHYLTEFITGSRKMECRCGVMKVVSFVPSRSVLSPGITTQWSTPFQKRRWQSSPKMTEHHYLTEFSILLPSVPRSYFMSGIAHIPFDMHILVYVRSAGNVYVIVEQVGRVPEHTTDGKISMLPRGPYHYQLYGNNVAKCKITTHLALYRGQKAQFWWKLGQMSHCI